MNLNHVAVFAEVVRAGSFTAAAAALQMPKSSVSRTVSSLEAELGVRLLHRTTRALGLTDAGRVYYERVQRALAVLGEAASAATDDSVEPRGLVRMTAPADTGAMELVGMLARFRADHPEITVEVCLSGRFVDLVDEGFDLVIRGGRLDDSSLIARRIGTTDFALYAAPAYLARRGAPKTLDDLNDHDCVYYKGRDARAAWRLTGPNGVEERIELRAVVTADELGFVRRAVETGIGIGLLPILVETRCNERARVEGLVRVLPDYAALGGALHIVTPPLEHAPLRVTLLRDFLIAEFSERYREDRAKPVAKKPVAKKRNKQA